MPLKTVQIQDESQINLTPMIDIVFLLIIFFIVGTQFTQLEHQYDIQLPTVSQAQPLTSLPDEIIINIRGDGIILVDNQVRTLNELEQLLQTAKSSFSDQVVLIRGQGRGPYQHIMDVLDVCRRAKINHISLANRLKSGDK